MNKVLKEVITTIKKQQGSMKREYDMQIKNMFQNYKNEIIN